MLGSLTYIPLMTHFKHYLIKSRQTYHKQITVFYCVNKYAPPAVPTIREVVLILGQLIFLYLLNRSKMQRW